MLSIAEIARAGHDFFLLFRLGLLFHLNNLPLLHGASLARIVKSDSIEIRVARVGWSDFLLVV